MSCRCRRRSTFVVHFFALLYLFFSLGQVLNPSHLALAVHSQLAIQTIDVVSRVPSSSRSSTTTKEMMVMMMMMTMTSCRQTTTTIFHVVLMLYTKTAISTLVPVPTTAASASAAVTTATATTGQLLHVWQKWGSAGAGLS